MVILITGCGDCTWMILVNFVTALAFRCVLMLSCDLRILSLHPPPYCMVSVPEWLKSLSIGPTGEPNAIVFCTVGHTWPGARFSIEVPITFEHEKLFCVCLNFIWLIQVVITPSVMSEMTGRPVTSLLLCFNSCKKLNTIFKWQTKKYRLEMSAWYRMALLFFDRNSCLRFKLSTACSTLNRL